MIVQEYSFTDFALSLTSTPIPTALLMRQFFRVPEVFLPATITAPYTSTNIEAVTVSLTPCPVATLTEHFDLTEHWSMSILLDTP